MFRTRSLATAARSARAFAARPITRSLPPTTLTPLATRVRYASSAASMSSSAPHLPPIPSFPKITVTPPSLDAIREEGFMDDAKLVPENEARINITPEAIRQLAQLAANEPPDTTLALRVGVDSGGCHGYQYIMELVEEKGVDDYVMQAEGAVPVLVDLMSLGMLKGATLHYATELIGSSFRLQDNPQAKEGGNCGCGVSWEAI
ncbi:hypothetical protein CspHIS471_0210370 [Cutaneotrichosporon sp. HIS471]|nr:hypothetical protein CspHIS471_0210370 [Cutaneotrichosporon sp. HIS471]